MFSNKIAIADSQAMAKARGFQHRLGLEAFTGGLYISGVVLDNSGNDAAVALIVS